MIGFKRVIAALPVASLLLPICCAVLLCAVSKMATAQPAPAGRSGAAASGARTAAPVQVPKEAVPSKAPRTANIHLHGAGVQQAAAPQSTGGRSAAASSLRTTSARPQSAATRKSALARAPRWNYKNWAAQHMGLGTIEGWIRGNSGQPLKGIRVALRGPKGKIFANVAMRHITFTDATGHFLMCNVKARPYRIFVRTADKKKKTHVQTNLDPGGHLELGISLNV